MKKKSKLISTLLVGTCLFTLVSCGSDDDDSSSAAPQQEQQQDDQGVYRAVLSPLNSNVAGTASGTVEISIEGDDFRVVNNVTGVQTRVKHLQNITLGTACPTEASDANGDTFVDVAEALASTGPILIPLDLNLGEQLTGMSYGPYANTSGTYVYRRSTTLTDLLSDLRAPDPDPQDAIVKLPDGQNLNLSGRVVMIHGVTASNNLPATVATFGEHSAEESLPIACGQLVRVIDEGGTTGTTTGGTTGGTTTGGTTTGGTTTGETGTGTTTGGTTTGETGTTTGETGTTTGSI